MPKYVNYETIYAMEKLKDPDPPLVEDPIQTLTGLEMTYMDFAGTLLNPDGRLPTKKPYGAIALQSLRPQTYKYGLPVQPFIADPAGDEFKDARDEYNLLATLNGRGNYEARRDFTNVVRYLNGKLSQKEINMLKLPDFVANENLRGYFKPGMATALGILRDCWTRGFSRKAGEYARYNPHIYWIPWFFFMEDDYISSVKDDLVANLFNENAKKSLRDELFKADKLGDRICEFDFTEEHPLIWSKAAYQYRAVKFYPNPFEANNPKYWALGNFSIRAIPKGTAVPLEGGGHKICVSDVYLFIHDTFNFEGLAFLAPGILRASSFLPYRAQCFSWVTAISRDSERNTDLAGISQCNHLYTECQNSEACAGTQNENRQDFPVFHIPPIHIPDCQFPALRNGYSLLQ